MKTLIIMLLLSSNAYAQILTSPYQIQPSQSRNIYEEAVRMEIESQPVQLPEGLYFDSKTGVIYDSHGRICQNNGNAFQCNGN